MSPKKKKSSPTRLVGHLLIGVWIKSPSIAKFDEENHDTLQDEAVFKENI